MIKENEGKILVIDKQGKSQQIFQHELKSAGFKVHITESGIEGIKAAKKIKPHLILLDIGIDDFDGFEVLKTLQKDTVLMDIPILIMTSQGGYDNIIRSFKMGASDYVKKPFYTSEVIARCKTLVSLKQKNDVIRNSHNFIDNLMRGMAHDLNTIFNAMIHFDVIEKTVKEIENKIPSKIHESLNEDFKLIEKTINYLKLNIKNGAEIIKNSIDIHEVNQSIKSLNSIDDIIQSIVDVMRRNLAKSNVKLDLNIQKHLPPIFCNKLDIHRLVVNIIINSIYAINKIDNPLIKIRLWENVNVLKISISDNGRGIPDSEIPHIFEEHFTTREKGNGMGLTLVKHIVDDLGGEISVFSNVGEGTTFTISIPAGEEGELL